MTQRTYYSEDARQRAQKQQTALVVSSLLVGAGVGAIITFLLSPMTGDEARDKVGDAVESGRDHIEDGAGRIQRIVS